MQKRAAYRPPHGQGKNRLRPPPARGGCAPDRNQRRGAGKVQFATTARRSPRRRFRLAVRRYLPSRTRSGCWPPRRRRSASCSNGGKPRVDEGRPIWKRCPRRIAPSRCLLALPPAQRWLVGPRWAKERETRPCSCRAASGRYGFSDLPGFNPRFRPIVRPAVPGTFAGHGRFTAFASIAHRASPASRALATC